MSREPMSTARAPKAEEPDQQDGHGDCRGPTVIPSGDPVLAQVSRVLHLRALVFHLHLGLGAQRQGAGVAGDQFGENQETGRGRPTLTLNWPGVDLPPRPTVVVFRAFREADHAVFSGS